MTIDLDGKLTEALATGLAIAAGSTAFGIGPDTPDRQTQRDWFRAAAAEQLAARPPTQDAYDKLAEVLRLTNVRAVEAEARFDAVTGMAADLDGYIERRATELTEPIVEEARKAAAVTIRAAEADALRWKDLNAELGRQIKVLETQLDRKGAA